MQISSMAYASVSICSQYSFGIAYGKLVLEDCPAASDPVLSGGSFRLDHPKPDKVDQDNQLLLHDSYGTMGRCFQ